MPKKSTLYLLFNHTLTPDQKSDAYTNLAIDTIQSFPPKLLNFWGDIPTDLENLSDYLQPFKSYIVSHLKKGDYLFVQTCWRMISKYC